MEEDAHDTRGKYETLGPREAILSLRIIKRNSFHAKKHGMITSDPAFHRARKSREMRFFYLDLNVVYVHRIVLTSGPRCSRQIQVKLAEDQR